MENKRRVTKKQLQLLLEELETKPVLCYDYTLNGDRKLYVHDWDMLVEKLNAVPNGAKRSVSRWKDVLKDWKKSVKEQSNSEENVGKKGLDDLGKRLLKLIEGEEHLESDNDGIEEVVAQEADNENEIFKRPTLRILGRKRPRLVISGFGEGSLLNKKRIKSLKTIYDNNTDRENNPEQKIITMQLSRLHDVSQQLENHIKQVQDRIQRIKDMWQHECADGTCSGVP